MARIAFFISLLITLNAKAQPADTTIYTVTDSMPVFPGGTDALKKYLEEHTRYPVSEMQWDTRVTVIVRFVVEKDGTVSGVVPVKEVKDGPGFTAEALRVARSMPFWFPAYNKGLSVRCYMYIPVKFVPAPKPAIRDTLAISDNAPLVNPEVHPMFPGGDSELMKYIRGHIVYPQLCLEIGVTGVVWVNVTVETDGSLSEITAAKEVKECPPLTQEALRLVKNMPRWIPGTYNGTTVRMGMRIPVRFVLN